MTENTHESPYFDLITSGIGYLNRARTVRPSQGSPYECVSIAALRGHTDNPQYSYFDCRVVGSEALEFIKAWQDAINERDTKVMVRFNVGDGEATSYEIQRGDNQGQRRHQIKGRLLKITWAKVGDQEIDLKLTDDTDSDKAGTSDTVSADNPKPRTWRESIGEEVAVAKDDPDYDRKIAYLEAQGYQWQDDKQVWHKAA